MLQSKYVILILMLAVAAMQACIGTDLVDEPLGSPPSEAVIDQEEVSLIEGESTTLTFRLQAADGSEMQNVDWSFSSRSTSVASVDNGGTTTGVGTGQTWVEGVAMGEFKDSVLVTVVDDPNAVASVSIDGESGNLLVGETRQLTATVRNANGDILQEDVTWSSLDDAVATVSSDGLITAIADGSTSILASVSEISAVPFEIVVGAPSEGRSGEFGGRNGYSAVGAATLETSGMTSTLTFSDDFRTQNGPGLYVYLSPTDNNVNGGLNLGKIVATSGRQSYTLPEGSSPSDYNYAIIYCKPFGVLFAAAFLE